MKKHTLAIAIAAVIALVIVTTGVSSPPTSVTGTYRVDSRHSDAQIITDGTTDYGNKKVDITLGFGRINGELKLDDNDPTQSRFDFRFYPATSISPPIAEDGDFKARWLMNLANHTLVCFHSKKVVRTPEGRLQATGELVLTRVDRNIVNSPGEDYAGPIYGPPMIHRVTHEATFVFDFPASAQKDGGIRASGSTKVFKEDFPQLVKAVVMTYWPPVVQDESCQAATPSESYSGPKCTGTFLETPGLPTPDTRPGEDYPGPSNYSAVVGERLNVVLHMRLTPKTAGEPSAGGN